MNNRQFAVPDKNNTERRQEGLLVDSKKQNNNNNTIRWKNVTLTALDHPTMMTMIVQVDP